MNALLYFVFLFNFCQISENSIVKQHKYVLNKNIPGKEFTFGNIKKDGSELHLNYLGNVVTLKKKHYKILISAWYWGHATSRIFIYTDENEYYGQYDLGHTCDLPSGLNNNSLIFRKIKGCECSDYVTIDLSKGIPSSFFKPCKNGMGDIFSFNSDKNF